MTNSTDSLGWIMTDKQKWFGVHPTLWVWNVSFTVRRRYAEQFKRCLLSSGFWSFFCAYSHDTLVHLEPHLNHTKLPPWPFWRIHFKWTSRIQYQTGGSSDPLWAHCMKKGRGHVAPFSPHFTQCFSHIITLPDLPSKYISSGKQFNIPL